MFKKLAILLTPFVLAPLGSLLTPTVAQADSVHQTAEQICTDSTKSYVAYVKIQYKIRDSDGARLFTAYQFRDINFGAVRQSQGWERRVINEVSTIYKPTSTTNNPIANTWIPTYLSKWIAVKAGVTRYGHVWLYSDKRSTGNTCNVEIPF